MLVIGSAALSAVIVMISLSLTVENGQVAPLVLALFAIGAGTATILSLARRLNDRRVLLLAHLFLLKLLISLVILHQGWLPELSRSSSAFGYDPQRYYFDALTLMRNNFAIDSLPPLNYTGILYYFGAWFRIFGSDPVIPLLANTIVTVTALSFLMQVAYHIKPTRGRNDWMLGFCIVLPEVVWYDVLSARETLTMSLIVIAVSCVALIVVRPPETRLKLRYIAIFASAILLLAVVRTPLVIPTVASIIGIVVFCGSGRGGSRRIVKVGISMAAIVTLAVAPALSKNLGSYSYEYTGLLAGASSGSSNGVDPFQEDSFGRYLVPNNTVQVLAFMPVRVLVYMVVPLPSLDFDVDGIAHGSWAAWQGAAALTTSLIYIALMPLALASLVQTFRRTGDRAALLFHIPLWLLFLTVATGTTLIVPRYRLVLTMFLAGAAWLGRSADRRLLSMTYLVWSGGVVGAATLFTLARGI